MISFEQKGNFSKLTNFLDRSKEQVKIGMLDKYGRLGIKALSSATPKDTGLTSQSWYYKIVRDTPNTVRLMFCNSNVQNGAPIAIILQYGHATNNGGWVEGIDYINPAIRSVFDELARDAWKEVTR